MCSLLWKGGNIFLRWLFCCCRYIFNVLACPNKLAVSCWSLKVCFENLPVSEIETCGNHSLVLNGTCPCPTCPGPQGSSVRTGCSRSSLTDPMFFRRTWIWITALYHVRWVAEVSLEAWMTLRRTMMKTVGIAPEGGEASPVGFLMKSFKCKY